MEKCDMKIENPLAKCDGKCYKKGGAMRPEFPYAWHLPLLRAYKRSIGQVGASRMGISR